MCVSYSLLDILHEGMAVIPKCSKCKLIEENYQATQIELHVEEMKQLRGLDKNHRIC